MIARSGVSRTGSGCPRSCVFFTTSSSGTGVNGSDSAAKTCTLATTIVASIAAAPLNQLTYDHVIPVAKGGIKSWENIVTCCIECNRKKGNRSPAQANLRLLRIPKAPSGFPYRVRLLFRQPAVPESWKDYIFWPGGT